jgi:hypothetical protein
MADKQQELINRLYPSSAPQGTEVLPEEPATQPPGESPAEEPPVENYGYEPQPEPRKGNPYSIDGDSPEDRFYGGSQKVDLRGDTDLSIINPLEEEQATLRDNLGFMAAEVGADQSDIHAIIDYSNKALTTGEIFDTQESMKALYEQHGSNLTNLLDAAQQLVRSLDPDLTRWLDETGLGNSPVMINHFIRIAQSPRAKARLQKLQQRGRK